MTLQIPKSGQDLGFKGLICYIFVEEDAERGGKRASVATGNWGCGAFGGDQELKFVQQIIGMLRILLRWPHITAEKSIGTPLQFIGF